MGHVPRVVLVTRPTDYESLVVRHGTREQARFFLKTRGQVIEQDDGEGDTCQAQHRAPG